MSRLAVRTGSALDLEVVDDPRQASLVVDCPSPLARPFPSLEEMMDAMPEIMGRLLMEKLRSLQPLILYRVKITAQPGVAKLVLAAHAMGTRETGAVENVAGSLYDHKGEILTVLAAVALVALAVRRRRRKRSA